MLKICSILPAFENKIFFREAKLIKFQIILFGLVVRKNKWETKISRGPLRNATQFTIIMGDLEQKVGAAVFLKLTFKSDYF